MVLFDKSSLSMKTLAKIIFETIVFRTIYITLSAGPLIYFLKNFGNPADFLLNFSMITFTVGMFSYIVSDKREKYADFDKAGSMYLLSGSLSLTLLFVTPLLKNSEKTLDILPKIISSALNTMSFIFVAIVFAISVIGFSLSFGIATTEVIKPTLKEFTEKYIYRIS